jgi:hypothetical protein
VERAEPVELVAQAQAAQQDRVGCSDAIEAAATEALGGTVALEVPRDSEATAAAAGILACGFPPLFARPLSG